MTIYIEATLKSNTALLNAGQLQPFITGMLTLTLTTNLITTCTLFCIMSYRPLTTPCSVDCVSHLVYTGIGPTWINFIFAQWTFDQLSSCIGGVGADVHVQHRGTLHPVYVLKQRAIRGFGLGERPFSQIDILGLIDTMFPPGRSNHRQ